MNKKIFLLGLCLYLCLSVVADTIYLKNGNRITGTIVKKTKKHIVVEMAFGKITIAKKNIASIEKDSPIYTIIQQGERLVSLGAMEHALKYFENAIEKYPGNARLRKSVAKAFFHAAQEYLSERKVHLARQAFEKANYYSSEIDVENSLNAIEELEKKAENHRVQGNALLEEKDYQGAFTQFAKAIKAYPIFAEKVGKKMALACLYLGSEQAKQRQFRLANYYFKLTLEYEPKYFPVIEKNWLYVQMQLINQEHLRKKQWQQALTSYEKLLKIAPTYAPALFFSGIICERSKKYQLAYLYYQHITKINKPWNGKRKELIEARNLAQRKANIVFVDGPSLGLVKDTKSSGIWNTLKTKHFVVHHQNDAVGVKVANRLEFHWNSIRKRLGGDKVPKWRSPCNVYVHPSRKQYIRLAKVASWSEGVAMVRYLGGKFYSHEIHVYMSAPLLLPSILPHEVTHVLYPWLLNYSKFLPLWLNEGVAMSSEPGFRQRSRYRILRNAIRKREYISLKQLFNARGYPKKVKKVHIFYSQSYSIVDYLLSRGGSQKLLDFVRLASKDSEKAIRAVYGFPSVAAFERQWLRYVQKKK